MKATKLYFHVVLFIMLYKVVLTFMSVDETLVCDHSSRSYGALPSCGTFIMLYKIVLTFKATEQCFRVVLFCMLFEGGLSFAI